MGIASIHGVGSTTQRSKFAGALAFAVVAASFGAGLSARADTFGNNGGNLLSSPGSWINETPAGTHVAPPGATDIAAFDSNAALTAATIYTLGAPTTWAGIQVVNPGAAVTIDFGQNSLALGASGVDMSAAAQNLTLAPTNLTIAAAQAWNVVTARTLTVSSTVDLGSNILTLQGAGTTAFQNTIMGAGGLVISGPGVVTLGGGGNSYSGATTLNAGTLNINSGTALGTGTFIINGGTINNTSGIPGLLTNNNTQAWNGNFTFTGGTALDMGSGAVTLGANVTVTATANVFEEDGVISGAFGLTKAGAGTLTLTAANAFTGATTISAGVLNFNAIGALGTGTAINLNGGTLQYGGSPDDISVRTVTLSATSSIDTNGQTVTFANSIGNGGAGGLTKTGAGTLVLAGSNNYTGATTVTGDSNTTTSILEFSALAALGSGSTINISNGTLLYAAGNTADITVRTVNVSGTLAAVDLNGNSVTYAKPINGTGTLTLANTPGSAVTVTLNAANQYFGTLGANSGVTLVLGNAAALQSASVTLNSGSALNFGSATAVTLGGLGGVANVQLTNASLAPVTLTLGGNNQGGTYTGVLSDFGSNLPVTKIGSGTQNFGGANTFGGNLVVDGGVVNVVFNAALLSQVFYSGAATPGNLILGGGEFTTNSVTNVTSFQKFTSTTLTSGQSNIFQPGRTASSHPAINVGSIVRTVGATVDIEPQTGSGGSKTDVITGIFSTNTNGVSGILGGWATENGTDWAVNNGGANGTNGGQHIYNLATYNANTFAVNTNNTDVTANMTATAGATTGSVRFNTAASLKLTTSGANVIATGGILVTPTVGVNTPAIIPADSSSTLTSGNGSDLIVFNYDTGAGSSFTIQTPIVNNGSPIALTKSGVGTLILSGNNTFSGGVYLNQGVLQVGNAGALNSATPNAIFFANSVTTFGTPTSSSGTLTLAGNSIAVSQLSTANVFAGTPMIQNANATPAVLTVNGATPSTFNGTIQNGTGGGSLGLTIAGPASLTLSGSNTYTGNTTISGGGKLILTGASNIAASNTINVGAGSTLSVSGLTSGFSVASAQTLGGNGTIIGSVNLAANAVLAPGMTGVGTLTMDGLTLNPNSTTNFEFSGGLNDLLVVNNSGGLVINGTPGSVNINLFQAGTSNSFATNGTYNLFQIAGAIGGTGLSALVDANVPFGTQATFGTSGGFVTVTLAASTSNLPTWNLSGGGSWNVAGNWSPSGVPNAQGQTAILGGTITGPSTVTLDGTQTLGTIAFNNANSYTVAAGTGGSLVLDNGTSAAHLNGSQGNHTISANVVLNSNLSAAVTAGSVGITGVISEGTAGKSITMNGAGTLILGNANTYTGGTIMGSGTVQVGNNASLGTGSLSFSAAATLQAGATVALANNISVASGATANIDSQANTLTLSGIVSSADATAVFNKIGSGTLIVTGTNTFTGTVSVNGGTMQLGDGVTNGSFTAASITTVNSTLAFNTVGTVTVANTITGTGAVVQKGANTVTLTGANTFSGGLNINSGTVSLGTATTTDPAGSGNITMANGTTLLLPGFGASTTPTYSTIGNNIIVANGANVTIGGQPRATFAGGVFGNGTLNYEVQYVRGAITGDWSNFTGVVNLVPTTPSGGTGPAGDFRVNSGLFDGSHAAFNVPVNANVYTLITGGTIAFGDLTGNGTLMTGDSNLGTLSVGNTEIAGQTTTFTGTIGDSTVGRATSFTKNGAGTLDLASTNGFTGIITVNGGTLTFAGAVSTPTVTAGISVAAGATLDLNSYNPSITAATNVTSNGITGGGTIGSSSTSAPSAISYNVAVTSTFSGAIVDSINGGTQPVSLTVTAGQLNLSGTNTYSGATTISAGTLQLGAGGTTGSIVATPTTTITDNGVLGFNRSDNVAFGAIISGAGGVTQVGPGIVSLTNAANSFSGTVTITGGTLQMVPAVQLGNGAVPLVVTAGTFDLNGTSTTVGSLNGAAAGVIDNVSAGGAATLTTGSLNTEDTFAGTIKNTTGTLALVKNGSANLTLSGASTYSGGTTLNSGGLYATNTTGSATGTGAVHLNGGTLGGTGILGGTITAGSGPHTISPGANTPNAIGTLTAGGLSTNANTTLAVDLAAPGGTNDLLAITGNVSLAGGNITLGSNPLTGVASLGYYKIMTYSGTLSGTGMTVAATSTGPNVIYTLDTSTAGVINIHKGFIGDANDDGTVSLTDLSIVLNNFGSATTSWSLGNFDGSSSIDLTDLSDVLNNFGSNVATTAVSTGSALVATPEPASLAIVVPAAMALLRRRRSGSR